jgi:hypothetical protein
MARARTTRSEPGLSVGTQSLRCLGASGRLQALQPSYVRGDRRVLRWQRHKAHLDHLRMCEWWQRQRARQRVLVTQQSGRERRGGR